MKNNNFHNEELNKLINSKFVNTGKLNENKENSDIIRILKESEGIKVTGNKNKEDAWTELSTKLTEKKKEIKSYSISRFVKVSVSVAASIIILIGLYFLIKTDITSVVTAKGEHYTINLPDGSELILNAESKAEYNKNTWDKNRNVKLKGEAFFKVKKGSRFTVNTEKGEIEVLGTSFNVYSRAGIFEVKCFSGKVKVSNKTSSLNKVITKGKAVKISANNKFDTFEFEEKNKSQWLKGKFLFNRASLNEVFKEIERQYNIEVKFSNADERIYTGFFNNKNLEQALKNVCIPMGLDYKISSNKVIITQKLN